jgi:hypothetical protein
MPAPPGLDEQPRVERLRTASRTHMMQLRCLQQEAMAAWHESKKPKQTRKSKGAATAGESVPEASVMTQHGDRRHWQDAMFATERIIEFEGFDRSGHVDVSCDGRVPEAPKQTNNELFRDIKRRVMTGFFDTPEDEGVPGAWEKEMRMRNAAVAAKSPGVGSIFGQQNTATANSGRPENRPDPFAVARPTDVISAKGPSEFSGQPSLAEGVMLPENTEGPGELLYPNATTSAQSAEQQVVTTKTESQKVLLNSSPAARKPGRRRVEDYSPAEIEAMKARGLPLVFYTPYQPRQLPVWFFLLLLLDPAALSGSGDLSAKVPGPSANQGIREISVKEDKEECSAARRGESAADRFPTPRETNCYRTTACQFTEPDWRQEVRFVSKIAKLLYPETSWRGLGVTRVDPPKGACPFILA